MTNLNTDLIDFVSTISASNSRFHSKKKAVLNLYLNNPYFELSDRAKAYFYHALQNFNITLHFIQDVNYTHPSIEKAEFLIIDDISLFNRSETVLKLFSESFVDKSIIATYKTDIETDTPFKENLEGFTKISEIMNLKTDFEFIPKRLV